MKRCIELAKNGLGTTYPNPLVGAVIVHDGRIIGEGWHRKSGEAHAEVNAVNSVKDQSLLAKSTIYVSLEPCSHFGKTPPCCDLIIQKNIPEIVIGTIDPFALVSGNGISKLEAAGKKVIVGILEEECRELNKRFFTFHQKNRPHIILKWAESADGFIAPLSKDKQKPVWLSNEFSRQLTHKWRTEEQAILIGTQTAIDDNPQLNARNWRGKNPVRIVMDRQNRIPEESLIFDNSQKTIVLSESENGNFGKNTAVLKMNFNGNVVENICKILHEKNIQSVIIEGGKKTIQTFINENLWDEARIFRAPVYLRNGIKSPVINGNAEERNAILGDELIILRNS